MLSRREALAALVAPALPGQERKVKMFDDPVAYERFMGRWSKMLALLLVDFADIGDAGKALDVGSGTGALAFSIAKVKPHAQVMGIDPSQEYVKYAKIHSPFPNRTNFEVGDAQQLRFADASFENSLSLLVFNFIPDRKKALREVSRVTKPGGCVAAAVWDYGGGMRMLRAFWDAVVVVDPSADASHELHMPLCRAGELGDFWRQGGLEQVTERPLDFTMRFESFADYWEPFLLGQGAAGTYLHNVGDARRQALRSEVKRQLAISSEDAPFSLPARAWAVRGIVGKRG